MKLTQLEQLDAVALSFEIVGCWDVEFRDQGFKILGFKVLG